MPVRDLRGDDGFKLLMIESLDLGEAVELRDLLRDQMPFGFDRFQLRDQ